MIALRAVVGGREGYVTACRNNVAGAITTERVDSAIHRPIGKADTAVRDGELLIVKVDFEGFEADLFARDTEWLERAHVVYTEPRDWLFSEWTTGRKFRVETEKRKVSMFLCGENPFYIRSSVEDHSQPPRPIFAGEDSGRKRLPGTDGRLGRAPFARSHEAI